MEVHNINGTADNKCKCGSWKAHWEKFNDKGAAWPALCREVTCREPATHGAHVLSKLRAAKIYLGGPLRCSGLPRELPNNKEGFGRTYIPYERGENQ